MKTVFFQRIFGPRPAVYRKPAPSCRIVVTRACQEAISLGLTEARQRQHEGILYLIGQTDGKSTLIASAMKPAATTTPGSFFVSPMAMAQVIRFACDAGLKVVGQIHTHPGEAYHSGGDEDGARIAYDGFVSIVLPNYGQYLPSWKDGAVFMFQKETANFRELTLADVTLISEAANGSR